MSSDTWRKLYTEESALYDDLVGHEDYQGNLIAELNYLHPLDGAKVVDFGAGTGRITRQIVPKVQWVWAFDLIPTMISISMRIIPS